MEIRLNTDAAGVGKAGMVLTVSEPVGNDLHARGLCEVIAHDPPGPDVHRNKMVNPPKGNDDGDSD